MFWQRVKDFLTKRRNVYAIKEYKIVGPGLIAISVIFLQGILSVYGPDVYQVTALYFFSIAISVLAVHLLIIQMLIQPGMSLPFYLSEGFHLLFSAGMFCTFSGMMFVLIRVSPIAPLPFLLGLCIGMAVYYSIRSDRKKNIKTDRSKKAEEEIIYD